MTRAIRCPQCKQPKSPARFKLRKDGKTRYGICEQCLAANTVKREERSEAWGWAEAYAKTFGQQVPVSLRDPISAKHIRALAELQQYKCAVSREALAIPTQPCLHGSSWLTMLHRNNIRSMGDTPALVRVTSAKWKIGNVILVKHKYARVLSEFDNIRSAKRICRDISESDYAVFDMPNVIEHIENSQPESEGEPTFEKSDQDTPYS